MFFSDHPDKLSVSSNYFDTREIKYPEIHRRKTVEFSLQQLHCELAQQPIVILTCYHTPGLHVDIQQKTYGSLIASSAILTCSFTTCAMN